MLCTPSAVRVVLLMACAFLGVSVSDNTMVKVTVQDAESRFALAK